jgi:hypothetical protein
MEGSDWCQELTAEWKNTNYGAIHLIGSSGAKSFGMYSVLHLFFIGNANERGF